MSGIAADAMKRSRDMTVLVTGATGGCGGQVVRTLSESGSVNVRALVRDTAKANAMALAALPNVEVVKGDFMDTDSLKAAMAGVERVFLTCRNNPDQATMEKNVVAAAQAAGSVTYLVKISTCSSAVGQKSAVSYGTWHWEIEQALEASGIKFTCLYPEWFMKNMVFFYAKSVKESGTFQSVFEPENKVAMIDPDDIGASAAALLLMDEGDQRTFHRHYKLTGPAAVTQAEVAAAFGEVLGKEVKYEPLTIDEFVALLKGFGFFPEWLIEALTNIMIKCRQGDHVTNDVEYLTGKPATSVKAWIEKNTAAFSG